MKRRFLFLIGVALTALAGCATTTQQAQVQYVQACGAYGSAFSAAVQLRSAGKLNQAQIDAVTKIDQQITPICTGPLPANPQAATAQVTAAVTTLGLLGAASQLPKVTK